jgi:hypothetical protein
MPNLTARDMLARLPVRMAVGGEARAFSDDEVNQFIESTYAQFGGPSVEAHKAIADAMAQYGVGVNQVARVTGYSPLEVEAEFMGQRGGQAPVYDDPTGSLAPGSSAGYLNALSTGGLRGVEDYYANLRQEAEAYLANPNAPTGVDAYNQLIQSGISTSDLRNAGIEDAVLNKIFTVSGPIDQSQFVTPAGLASAYERTPGLAYEVAKINERGEDGRSVLDAQGRAYIANLMADGVIDDRERAEMLEYATERGYTFQDYINAGVDPNVLFRQRPVEQPAVQPPPTSVRPPPFPEPVPYTPPTVYQPLPTQPDIYAPGEVALDQAFRDSPPRTEIPSMPGQFEYTPAAKLKPATGAGYSWTPPSVTSRPRSLLSPLAIQGYGGLQSASQRFAQDRARMNTLLRSRLDASPALRTSSAYNMLRNRLMSGEFGQNFENVFNPQTEEGQRFERLLRDIEARSAPMGGATTGTMADFAGAMGTGGYGSPVVPIDLRYGPVGGQYALFSQGGAVKKSNGSAKDELARFADGGEARRPLSPNDPLYITEDDVISSDNQIPLDELLLRQLEGIDNAPSARTPATDYLQTESRSMLDRLKGAGSAVNRAFYENISKPAVGAAVDMTVGLGDLAQMGARYLGDRAGMDTGEFTPAAPRVREALGVEGYNPYTIGGTAAFVLPFAGASRGAQAITGAPSAVSNLTSSAAGQLQSMFPNLARELAAYGGSEAGMLAAEKLAPDSTAAQLFAALAGGTGGSFAGSRVVDAGPVSRIDAPTGDEPLAGSAASMLEGLSAPAAPASPVIGSSVIYRSPGSEQQAALDAIKNIAQERVGAGAKAKVKIEDIANFHQQNHINQYGRQLDQFNDNDFNAAVDAAVDEVRYQLGQAESGKGWYDADVQKTFEIASRIPGLENLARSETDRVIMSAIMAPTSIGQYVPGNTRAAIASMLQYKRTGSVPTTPPAAGTITEGIQNAGWGVKQQSVAAGMRVINHLLNKFGPDGFADWWLSPHTLKEMTTLRKEAGLSGAPSGLGGGQNSMHLGAMILGDKTGRFSLNINGYEGTTKDVWFSRSYNRHFGNMFNNVGDVAGGPRNIKERQRMEEFTQNMQQRLADEGLSEQDIQAILWYYEQNLMTDLGVSSRPQAFSQEAEKIYGNLRPTVRAGDEAQIAAQQTGLEGFRGISATQRAVRAERRLPGRVDPRDPSRATGPYEAGAGSGDAGDGLLVLTPQADSLNRYQAAGLNLPAIREVPAQQSAAQYNAEMTAAMSGHKFGAQVEIKSPEELAQARLFRTEDGSGFAIKPDGDIVAVFAGKNAQGGSGYSMLQAAVAAGGRKLDAFDTYLPKIYETAGFRPVARLPWNDDYAPPGWNKETFAKYNNGEPDVVFFVYDPEYFGGARNVPVVSEYDQAVALQDQALRQLSAQPQGFAKGGSVTSSRRMLDTVIGKRVDETGPQRFAEGGEVTSSRRMLERLSGVARGANQAFYENISKPAVGTAIDMTLGLGDLAQMGARYVGGRMGREPGEFRSVAQPVKEALGVEDYNPYTLGGVGAAILPFAAAGRTAQSVTSIPTAASQLRNLFPNIGRETAAYTGAEAGAAAARELMPDSTAAEMLASVAGGVGGSALGSPPTSMGIIKEKGGNWLEGSIERELQTLRAQNQGMLSDTPANRLAEMEAQYTPAVMARMSPEGRQNVENSFNALRTQVQLDNWIDKKLGSYVKNEMATASDPIRLNAEAFAASQREQLARKDEQIARAVQNMEQARLERGFTPEMMTRSQAQIRELQRERSLIAEQTGLHINPDDVGMDRYRAEKVRERSGFPRLGYERPAQAWEDATDVAITQTKAGDLLAEKSSEWLTPQGYARLQNDLINKNPWLSRVAPDTPIYNMREMGLSREFGPLGFNHLIDEMKNAMRPNTDLPERLRIDPNDLSKMSVPQAVQKVDEINAWRASKRMEANLAKASNEATVPFRTYETVPGTDRPNERGLRWVELKSVDNTPESNRFLEEALKYEGDILQHCVGGYCPDVIEGRSRIYSLRDARGEPYVTIEVQPAITPSDFYHSENVPESLLRRMDEAVKQIDFNSGKLATDQFNWEKFIQSSPEYQALPKKIVQIKGKRNAAPSEEYLPFVQDFVRTGQWSAVGDLNNTRLTSVSPDSDLANAMRQAGQTPPQYVTNEELTQLRNQFSVGYAKGGLATKNNIERAQR